MNENERFPVGVVISDLKAQIKGLTRQLHEARNEALKWRKQTDKALGRAQIAETRLREIASLISYRHGDDDRFEEPENEMTDYPETITVKQIFKILEGWPEDTK